MCAQGKLIKHLINWQNNKVCGKRIGEMRNHVYIKIDEESENIKMDVKQLFDKEMENYFETPKVLLGPWTSESMKNDPKHLSFVLARYKFVAKMLEDKLTREIMQLEIELEALKKDNDELSKKRVLEIGCGDAFGTPIVANVVENLYAIDWEERFIKDNSSRLSFADNIRFIQKDINSEPLDEKVSAIYNIDFIEHLAPEKEKLVMENMISSYEDNEHAVMLIGTPNISALQYASPQSKTLHINLKSHKTLKELLSRYFYNVFIFGMNDEVIHTGYAPMCHYLWGMGVGLKRRM
mgnify:CR=1 FL=1